MPKVLIIERGEEAKTRFGERFAHAYALHTASTIEESLAVIQEQGIHCILLDVESMGREEGFLGIRRIKATNSNGKLPVIAILPEADPGLKTDSLLAGCTTFIIQPVSADSLDIIVGEVLNLSASFRPAAGTRAVS